MTLYKVFAGSINQPHEVDIYDCKNEEEAMGLAYEAACEDYETYVGLHGLRDIGEIMEEEDLDEEGAWDAYLDELESWINYYVEEVKE